MENNSSIPEQWKAALKAHCDRRGKLYMDSDTYMSERWEKENAEKEASIEKRGFDIKRITNKACYCGHFESCSGCSRSDEERRFEKQVVDYILKLEKALEANDNP